ncbi:MAG: NAD(P)H-dependent glycerol-3-phosphate dehydrogenase [Longimicrobiales bacterium]
MIGRIAVIGAGAWGTALADLLVRNGHDVTIWAYEAPVVDEINDDHENRSYLPGCPLAPELSATGSLAEAVSGAAAVVSVSPSQHVRRVMEQASPSLSEDALVISASKGIETSTRETMAEVLGDVLPAAVAARACFLSGPSFAKEVAAARPTAVVVASESREAALEAQSLFQSDRFRVYTNRDVMGVELGGALKNVMALAAGMTVGLGLGHNALAALITRGLAEMTRLGEALGADARTFAGLAGMGDLILTCTGDLSRNRRVGVRLGSGETLDEILGGMQEVAEGVETTRAAHALAADTGVEMPIVAEVHAVLTEGRHPREAVENLMMRDPKPEVR